MAFVSTLSASSVIGNLRIRWGTFTNTDADKGGDIATGLSSVVGFMVIPTGHVGNTQPKYSASGGTVTLVTDYDEDGNWFAIGFGGG